MKKCVLIIIAGTLLGLFPFAGITFSEGSTASPGGDKTADNLKDVGVQEGVTSDTPGSTKDSKGKGDNTKTGKEGKEDTKKTDPKVKSPDEEEKEKKEEEAKRQKYLEDIEKNLNELVKKDIITEAQKKEMMKTLEGYKDPRSLRDVNAYINKHMDDFKKNGKEGAYNIKALQRTINDGAKMTYDEFSDKTLDQGLLGIKGDKEYQKKQGIKNADGFDSWLKKDKNRSLARDIYQTSRKEHPEEDPLIQARDALVKAAKPKGPNNGTKTPNNGTKTPPPSTPPPSTPPPSSTGGATQAPPSGQGQQGGQQGGQGSPMSDMAKAMQEQAKQQAQQAQQEAIQKALENQNELIKELLKDKDSSSSSDDDDDEEKEELKDKIDELEKKIEELSENDNGVTKIGDDTYIMEDGTIYKKTDEGTLIIKEEDDKTIKILIKNDGTTEVTKIEK